MSEESKPEVKEEDKKPGRPAAKKLPEVDSVSKCGRFKFKGEHEKGEFLLVPAGDDVPAYGKFRVSVEQVHELFGG